MKKTDDCLLKLEKKIKNNTAEEFILNKFLLKPTMKISEVSKGINYLKDISSFVNKFQSENNKILENEETKKKLNIEEGAKLIENNSKVRLRKKKKSKNYKQKDLENINNSNDNEKYIELNLNLGILDVKKVEEKKFVEPKNISNEDKEFELNLNDENNNNDIPFIRVNKPNKKKDNFVNKNLLINIFNNNNEKNCDENKNILDNNENNNIENYPFINFKEDNFNKEILNFLKENKIKKNQKKNKKKIM